MKYGKAMRKDTVTVNPDGTYTVKGSGWFSVTLDAHGNVVTMAKGTNKLFVQEAKLTVEKHFGDNADDAARDLAEDRDKDND